MSLAASAACRQGQSTQAVGSRCRRRWRGSDRISSSGDPSHLRMKSPRFAWILVALLLLPGCATTTIRGKLRLPADPTWAAAAKSRARLGQRRGVSITDAVIYVDRISPKRAQASPTRGARPTMVQRSHRFFPRVLTIVAGTTVRFENRDRIYHKIFSVSPARRFTTGVCAPRKSREVTFNKPGVVRLFCELDRKMAGSVLVVPSTRYTQPDSTGTFEIRGLPRGRYRLTALHPTEGKVSRKLDLSTRDVGVRLRF